MGCLEVTRLDNTETEFYVWMGPQGQVYWIRNHLEEGVQPHHQDLPAMLKIKI